PAPAAAAGVDRVGDELLSGSTLPEEEHGRVGRRDLLDFVEQLAHSSARADELVERLRRRAGPLAQLAVLGHQAAALQSATEDHEELRRVDRLAEEVERAELDRLQH